MQCIEVGRFIVGTASLPAAIQYAYPFVGQSPHGGLMSTALIPVLAIERTGPEGFVDRLSGPFDEGLAKEGGALPAPMHPALLSATLSHWGNA